MAGSPEASSSSDSDSDVVVVVGKPKRGLPSLPVDTPSSVVATTQEDRDGASVEPSSSRESSSDGSGSESLGSEDTEEDSEGYEDAEANRARREANIRAMLDDDIQVERKSIMPKLLTIAEGERILRSPFVNPQTGSATMSKSLKARLHVSKLFVPWGSKSKFAVPAPVNASTSSGSDEAIKKAEPAEDVDVNPLRLWAPPEGVPGNTADVDPMLTKWLRPHQREGVSFMFECVTGIKGYGGQGLILADDMGLGKTLMGISLTWSLMNNGHELLGGDPIAKRAVIVCPTSLVSNWASEFVKWLQGRCKTLPLEDASADEVASSIEQFLHPRRPYHVMIVSYETFRKHAHRFERPGTCDLLICDEAHRLKNPGTQTNRALSAMDCKRRVMLTGTPIQNHLDEFYAMVSFANPGVLGDPGEFRSRYEAPILAGREPGAPDDVAELGRKRTEELSALVNQFILRRTNALLSEHLPPKVIQVVCCKLTAMQELLYDHFLQSKAAKQLLAQSRAAAAGADVPKAKNAAGALPAIDGLKKLCNHPKLIFDGIVSGKGRGQDATVGFDGAEVYFQGCKYGDGRAGGRGMEEGWEADSGKMAVLARMLHALWTRTKDRIVIVSNYTKTLDLIQELCRQKGYPQVRLDGTMGVKKRQKLVVEFNDPHKPQFVFLLSSKAGGCGLNLVGANRLVLFDPDWNPANDKQAAARVWRDGQRKRVFEYRFLSAGTIEEKIFQRQLSKEGLQQVVGGGTGGAVGGEGEGEGGGNDANRSLFSLAELQDIFTRKETRSDTYDSVVCETRARAPSDEAIDVDAPQAEAAASDAGGGAGTPAEVLKEQDGTPTMEDLKKWGHHSRVATVPDEVMQEVGDVSFVFTCEVSGCEIKEACGFASGGQASRLKAAAGSGVGRGSFRKPARVGPGALQSVANVAAKRGAGVAAAPAAKKARPVQAKDLWDSD
ncbi:unnamed protein product [Pedinophyceae sp. YPF-701]|nr:unnamed protein product [Pedinophyceae sp. YPF-701]